MKSVNSAAITATKLPINRITTKVMPINRGAAAKKYLIAMVDELYVNNC